MTIAATELPGSPKDILVDWQRSDQDNLLIKWSAPETEPASLITGYLLEIDDGNGGQFALAYDGSQDNNNLEALVSVTSGLQYRFRAFAVNFNGVSQPSVIASYYACTAP